MLLLNGWAPTSKTTDFERLLKLNFTADRTTFNTMIDLIPFFQAYIADIKMATSVG